MSHITTIKAQITDLESLKEACKELGLEFKENQKTYKAYFGNRGNNCEHAIGLKGNERAYEIGLVKTGNFWTPKWDTFGGGYGLVDKVGSNAENLISCYNKINGIKKTKEIARSKGFTFTTFQNTETNETEIILRKY